MKNRIKVTAETSEEPTQRIIANELASVSGTTMANLPRRENLGRTIRQQRIDRHQSHNPEVRAEIPVFPLEYQLSENEEQFLLFDSGCGHDYRILIFGTDQADQPLANSGEWYCDEIFAFAHRYFSNCIPVMLDLTAK